MLIQNFGCFLSYVKEKLAFFWIVKGESWLGLWESESVNIPYHPSIRHIAFKVDKDDIKTARTWLESLGIEVRTAFGFSPEMQPLVLPNNPHAHAAIYFHDLDGNSIELISPLCLDVPEDFIMMTLAEWKTITKSY